MIALVVLPFTTLLRLLLTTTCIWHDGANTIRGGDETLTIGGGDETLRTLPRRPDLTLVY